ncbi:MAG: VWA domain-containing protein [Candidatus Bathyarchaeota archaeon]|nr:MAG: VWA domain-containing protein [Candidatus Bathyarchaeota archaeon]
MSLRRILFPFTAIVDLEKLKLALIVNAVNPDIGGLLIRGPKGSGKTTAVRALTNVLPKIKVVKDCPFNCDPYDLSHMCRKCSGTYQKTGKFPIEEREMRVVDLPLGATEDRVVGSLDIEKAIKQGIEALEPGILAEANQNILYVDEINLLPDHIADDLLDAAATGWNVVEREGISVSHPSRFIFVGTMNPEEGELRPQLLDRFPLSVAIKPITSVEGRMDVVKRNMEFEANPQTFLKKYIPLQEELKKRIIRARQILPKVKLPEKLLEAICRTCLDLKVDGMRPDIVISKTAHTLAAFEGRIEVSSSDILLASELTLSHRTREGGFLEPTLPEEISKTFMAKVKGLKYVEADQSKAGEKEKKKPKGKTMIWARNEAGEKEERSMKKKRSKFIARFYTALSRITPIFGFGKRMRKGPKDSPVTDGVSLGSNKLRGKVREEPELTGSEKAIPTISKAIRSPQVTEGIPILTKIKATILKPFVFFFKATTPVRTKGSFVGKRAEAVTTIHRGRSRGWEVPHGKPRDIHLPATIRAAAKKQKYREKPQKTALRIQLEDVREKSRVYKAPMTIIFLIDLSGSMLLSIEEVKEALLKLHRDAYRYRDKVGLVALKDRDAIVVQHPITNLRVVANKLMKLRISGLTPLAAGMLKSLEVLKEARRRDRSTIPVMAIITDGSANIPLKRSLGTGEVRAIDEARAIVREYEDIAVKDVMAASKIIKKEDIRTVVINTNPHTYGREAYGLSVTKLIAQKTNGTHHALGRVATAHELVEGIMEKIVEDQRLIAHETSRVSFH